MLMEWEPCVHESYGDRVFFKFRVVGGQHDGSTASRFTDAKMTPKSALYKIACGLAGRKLGLNEEFNPDDFVGREYMIIVAETESGATRVESILPIEEDDDTPF